MHEATLRRFCDSIPHLNRACTNLQTLELDPGSIDIYQLSTLARESFARRLTDSIMCLTTLERLVWVPVGGPTNQSVKDTIQLNDEQDERRRQITLWIADQLRCMIADCRYRCLHFDLDAIQVRAFGNLGRRWSGRLLANISAYSAALRDYEGHIELVGREVEARVQNLANMEMGHLCRVLGRAGGYYLC
jgi:hypothetical protein